MFALPPPKMHKSVHEKSPKNVHEKSPFNNVHEKLPILEKSVHKMSLSTKCISSKNVRAHPHPSHLRFHRAWLLYYATGIAQVLISLLSLTGRWKDHKETALCWYLSVLPQPWAGKPIWKERKTNSLGRKTMLNNVRLVVDFSTAKY